MTRGGSPVSVRRAGPSVLPAAIGVHARRGEIETKEIA